MINEPYVKREEGGGLSISSFYNEEVPLLSNRLVLVLEPRHLDLFFPLAYIVCDFERNPKSIYSECPCAAPKC